VAYERARLGDAGWCTAEILRVRAESLADERAAETLLLEALGLAHQQGALAWELMRHFAGPAMADPRPRAACA
jgi:hypothetical protein